MKPYEAMKRVDAYFQRPKIVAERRQDAISFGKFIGANSDWRELTRKNLDELLEKSSVNIFSEFRQGLEIGVMSKIGWVP